MRRKFSKERKRKNPARNIRCQDKLNKCTINAGFTDWSGQELIGEGSFGKVFKYNVKYNNQPTQVAVKVVEFEFLNEENDEYDDLDKLYDEVEFYYFMSENNLGPKLYYAFFEILNESKFISGNQYFIMERMDMSCSDFLESKKFDNIQKEHVVSKMIKLLTTQVYDYKLLCADTKPQNFMINVQSLKIRLIDFSGEWCYYRKDILDDVDPMDKLDVFFIMQLIQLKLTMKEFIPDYKSDVYHPINTNYFYKHARGFLKEYPEVIACRDLPLQHYAKIQKVKSGPNYVYNIYEAADCLDLYYEKEYDTFTWY